MKTPPPFVTGSVWRHLVSLAFASSLGLMATFLVAFIDIYYVGLLGDDRLTAAVGFASTLAYYGISFGIAVGITISTLVSRAMGQGNQARARDLFSATWYFGTALSVLVSAILFVFAPFFVELIQAKGFTAQRAEHFLRIIAFSIPFRGMVMWGIFAMRLQGRVRLGLWTTLTVSGFNAVLDPIFIFAFGWGISGAALATLISTAIGGGIALAWVVGRSGWLQRPKASLVMQHRGEILRFYAPAFLTNLSTPLGSGIVMGVMAARYDDSAQAATAIIAQMAPLLFGFLLSLSGSVGPVVGQNFGAERYDRVKRALWRSVQIVFAYTLPVGLVVFCANSWLVSAFSLDGEGARVFGFYATFLVFTNGLVGLTFVSNAIFNNLGYPGTSTASNLLRDCVLMLPLCLLGATALGAPGVLLGQQGATLLVAFGTLALSWHLVSRLAANRPMPKSILRLPFVGFQAR